MIIKKLLICVILLAIHGSLCAEKENAEGFIKQMHEIYAEVFKDKLLLKKIDPTPWDELVARIGAYIKSTTNDVGLQKDFTQLSAISNDAISSSKLLYHLSFARSDEFKGTSSGLRVAQKLAALNTKNKELAEKLDNTVYFWGSKRQVQNVLLELSNMLSKIVTKAVTMYKISYFVYKQQSSNRE